eukprot:gene18863-biopygen699
MLGQAEARRSDVEGGEAPTPLDPSTPPEDSSQPLQISIPGMNRIQPITKKATPREKSSHIAMQQSPIMRNVIPT